MYITNAQVASFLNVVLSVLEQAVVDDIISAVEAYANNFCNRLFIVSGAQTEKFDGGKNTFFIKFPPINVITSVTVDGQVENPADVFNYKSHIKLASTPPLGNQNVVIVYTSAVTLPDDLKHALIRWAGQIFKSREDAGKDVSRVTVGSVSVDWLVQQTANSGIPDFVLNVLNKYKIEPL